MARATRASEMPVWMAMGSGASGRWTGAPPRLSEYSRSGSTQSKNELERDQEIQVLAWPNAA